MSRAFSEVAEGVLYGFRGMYVMKVEGVPNLFVEKTGTGAAAPTGYTETAGLIVDDSAAIGSRIDRQKGLGVGYDLSFTIEHNSVTTPLFKPPTAITALSADLDHSDTTIDVVDTTGFTTYAYIGREYVTFASTTSTQFQTVTRGQPNAEWKAYSVRQTSAISTWVTNVPMHWRGREVKLYVVPVDAYGKTHGADLLSDAAMIWRGRIQADPEPSRHGWSMRASSIERELERALAGTVSAQGRLEPDGDFIVTMANPQAVWVFEHQDRTSSTWSLISGSRLEFQPFTSYSAGDTLRISEWRSAVVSAAETAIASLVSGGFSGYGSVYWRKESADGVIRWFLVVEVQRDTGASSADADDYRAWMLKAELGLTANTPGVAVGNSAIDIIVGVNIPDDTVAGDYYAWQTSVTIDSGVKGSTLVVRSDTGSVNDIPSSGWVRAEIGGEPKMLRYDDVQVVSGGSEAEIILAGTDSIPQALLADPSESDTDWFTVEFMGRVEGSPVTALLSIIMSSGRGDNDGTYDTLDERYGYDIAAVDVASFTSALSSWHFLTADMAIEPSKTLPSLFGPQMELTRTAIVSRMEPDGSDVKIHCVRTDLAGTPVPALSITKDDLVVTGGREPIRVKERNQSPNRWDIVFQVGDDEQKLIVHDVDAQKAYGLTAREVKVQGVRKQDAKGTFTTWARAFFSDARLARVVEMDIVPWKHVQPGDTIAISIEHPDLWDPNSGPGSYTGNAFVAGSRLPPATFVQTATLVLNDAYGANTLSPAMQVTAFDSATAPTYIRVSGDYYDLCAAYLASSDPFTLVAFQPGLDVADSQYHTVDGVSGSAATYTELSIASTAGGHTLVADKWHLTMPITATSNDAQNLHAHVGDGSVFL